MSTPLLQATHVSVRYGAILAVDDASIEVAAGERVALVGANGAGKSSLLKAVVGLERIGGGQVAIGGRNVSKLPAHRRVAEGLALVPEGRGVFRELTVAENLELGSYLRTAGSQRAAVAADLARVLELFPRLAERRHQLAGTLSGGEQQMLAIGRALMTGPRLLVLDEPSLGLAPLVVNEIVRALRRLNAEQGLSLLVSEQNAVLGLGLAQRGYVLNGGRIVLQGDAAGLARQSELIDSYLGSSLTDTERKVA